MVDRLDRVAKAKAQLTNKGDYILSAKDKYTIIDTIAVYGKSYKR